MNTRRNKVLVTCAAIGAFLFSSCQPVEQTPVSKEEVSKIELTSLAFTQKGRQLTNKDTLEFVLTTTNSGGPDSAGAIINSMVDGTASQFVKTGAMAAKAVKVDTVKMVLTAGTHEVRFFIGEASSPTSIKLETITISVADIKIEAVKEVAVEKSAETVTEAITTSAVAEGTTMTELVANIDEILKDTAVTTGANKIDDNSKEILKTVAVLANDDLLISEVAAPTQISFEDTTVKALFIPLAKEETNSTTGAKEVVVEEGSFLVMIETPHTQVAKTEVKENGDVVEVTETKPVSVPMVVKRDEATNVTTIKNSFGGISIDANGNVDLLALRSRAIASEFWPLIQVEIAAAAKVFVAEMAAATTPAQQMNAFVKLIGKITSIISAYELMSVVTNDRPTIEVVASQTSVGIRTGNDRVITIWDTFTATAKDDKAGVKFSKSGTATEEFDPGLKADLLPATYTFVAVDSDGDSTTLTVTSQYDRQTQVNYYVHDQGGVQ